MAFAHRLMLLELVAELTEGHLEQLGCLRLNTARTIERALEVAAFDRVQGRLEIEAVLWDLDAIESLHRALAPHGLGQRVNAEHLPRPEHDGALQHVLELADIARPMIALEHRHR